MRVLTTLVHFCDTIETRLFNLALLLIACLFLSNAYAQEYTRMGLPKGAKHRIGKGRIHSSLAYSPDGTRIAAASSIGVWIYDAHTGEELALFTGHTEPVLSVAFSPDGKIVASGASRKWNWWRADSEIRLWDADTGEHLATLTRPPEIAQKGAGIEQLEVWKLVFSPDGKTLASASGDGAVRLWDIETGQYRTIAEGTFVPSVAFSPDGKTLVGGGWDSRFNCGT